MGVIRTVPNKIMSFIGDSWTELFKNIPLIVQVFIWYHVIPSLFLSLRQVPPFFLVVIAIGFFTSSRISELVKAGLTSLPKGQMQAAIALGMTPAEAYRYILLPQAFRIIIPPLTSESMGIIKNSSVAFAVSISELTMYSLQVSEETSRFIEIFTATTFLYFISSLTVNRISKFIEQRYFAKSAR